MEIKVQKQEKLIKFLIHNNQGLSFGNAQKLLRLGKVKVNGKRVKENIDIKPNDIVDIYTFNTSKPKVDIVYEDENILIVNKPQGIECATRDKSSNNTYSLEELFSDYNAIVVHRLDRLTEGLVILARSIEIARKFETYFKNKLINKYYMACIHGIPKFEGIMTAYLRKDEKKALVDVIDNPKDGYKEIITEFKILNKYDNYSLVDINLHTGRTHQIRGYFSHIGHPVMGDNKYSKLENKITSSYKGYFLTSYKLKFNLSDELSYLNSLNIEIKPSWLNLL